MEQYNVALADAAKADLRQTNRYIATQLMAPEAALRLSEAFDEAFAELEFAPEMYPIVPDERLAAKGYRLRPVKNYIVFYKINKKSHKVNVARVLYSRRDWKNILT